MSRAIGQRLRGLLRGQLPIKSAAAGGAGLDPIRRYHEGGRRPWSEGYSKVRSQIIGEALHDANVMARFRSGARLPEGYGPRMDERVVECPWTIARLRPGQGRVLDAGSVLNKPLFLGLPQLRERTLFVYSLDLNWVHLNPKVSYVWGDFRDPVLKDELFETIVCISTLEHVGMAPIPTLPYQPAKGPPPPTDRHAYRAVMREFRRMLVPGGQLLLTFPFGRAAELPWQQVFDAAGLRDVVASFDGELGVEAYYRYRAEGWQLSSAEECAECEYYNAIVRMPDYDPDYAAAARAVACLELIRPR
jgi:hypothetical protein